MRLRTVLCRSILTAAAVSATLGPLPAAQAASTHEGWLLAERVFDWNRDQGAYGERRRDRENSWSGEADPYHNEHVGNWAIGTFRGQNGSNGVTETITIRPDGSAELRTRDQPPRYGTFAGETLNFDTRANRVEPARGGIVIDGSYYNR